MKNVKNILIIALPALVIFGFLAFSLLKTPEEYSLSERRTLARMPDITLEELSSGRFMTRFEEYTQDQFPLRDSFRSLKANVLRTLFRQKDNHGLYLLDGYLSKLEYPENTARLTQSGQKLQQIRDTYLAGTDCRLYLSVVPDKNCFLAPLGGYPTLDYGALVGQLRERLPEAQYLDIFGCLSLEDYYLTDQHWRQERIVPVAQAIAGGMGAEIDTNFTKVELEVPFYGAYYGQAALSVQPDELCYLTNETLEGCTVTSYNTGKPKPALMYDLEKARGRDPYEMFLCGSDPLVVIENPNAASDRELVVFRDSFGSTLVPLLASGYAKITLVDLRYIHSSMLGSFIQFENQDVLFLYSTLVLNNTISM